MLALLVGFLEDYVRMTTRKLGSRCDVYVLHFRIVFFHDTRSFSDRDSVLTREALNDPRVACCS